MGDEEEKRAIAFATLLGLGLGAFYILKDDLREIWESPPEIPEFEEGKEEIKNEKKGEEEVKGEKIKAKRRETVTEMHNVQWRDLQDLLGSSYPGNDLLKIYHTMTSEQRDMWRRGIYMYGPESQLDRHFVYYDSYYLSRYGNRDLYAAFYWYVRGRVSFDHLLREYIRVIGNRLWR